MNTPCFCLSIQSEQLDIREINGCAISRLSQHLTQVFAELSQRYLKGRTFHIRPGIHDRNEGEHRLPE